MRVITGTECFLRPTWSVRLIMAFAIIGFPVAVVPVWDVDLTPERRRA